MKGIISEKSSITTMIKTVMEKIYKNINQNNNEWINYKILYD